MTLRVGIVAGLLSGLLLRLSSPDAGLGWLAWVALVPAATVALASPGGRAGRLAVPLAFSVYLELLLVPALPFGLAGGQFGDVALPVMIGDSPVLPVALVVVPLVGGLLYALRFGQAPEAARLPPRLRDLALVLVPALSWTALELVRVKLDPGGFWGPLFLSQHDLPTVHLAAVGGPMLLTVAIVAVNFALALAMVRAGTSARALAVAPASATALLVLSVLGSPAALQPSPAGRTLTVAAVQPGYDTAEDDRPELRYHRPGTHHLAALDTVRDLSPLTREAAARGARLVVWPEAAFYVDPRDAPAARRALERLAGEAGVTLVVPYFARSRRQSAAVAVSPDGGLSAARPKQRPMWFLGEDNDNKGRPEPLAAGGLRLATLLGVDSQDPGLARLLSARGAQLLASSTHDWPQLASQQRALAAVHAAASRVPVVRADWRFGSAVYDADGGPLRDAGTELRRTTVVGAVHPAATTTPYERIGDAVGWIAVAVVSLLLFARPVWSGRRPEMIGV